MMKNYISKTHLLLILFASISICSYSCSFIGNCIEGKGKIVEENIKLEDFSKIELFGSSKVYVNQGKSQSISVKAHSNLIELLSREVLNETWEIKFSECIRTHDPVEIYITLPTLEEIDIKGSGEVISEGVFNCEKLELSIKGSGEIALDIKAQNIESSIMGSGDIKLKGMTNNHDISIKGSGDISAYDLNASDTDVEIKGSGDVKVNTSSSLDVEIYGSGDVYYTGNVQDVSSNIKGSGSLSRK